MKHPRLFRTLLIGAAAAAVSLSTVTSSSAAAPAPVKPAVSCKVPVLTVSPTTAMPGTKVTVTGKYFSGCAAQGSTAKPTAVLTVKVGVITAAKVQEVLATTKTDASGSFSVKITIPSVPAGGKPKIDVAAAAVDTATKLEYVGVAEITYTMPAPPTTTPTTTAAPTTTAKPTTTTASATPAPTSSSVDTPTAVPAGSGGMAAPASSLQLGTELGLGAAGIALVAFGGYGAARRRVRQH